VIHRDTDRRVELKFREIWPTGNRQNRAWQKKQNFVQLSRSCCCSDRAENLPGPTPGIHSECSRFHQNRFTFGGVIPERVNTIKTGRKVFPIFGWALKPSLEPNNKQSSLCIINRRHCRWLSRLRVGMIVERTEWNAKRPPRATGNYDRSSRISREWRFVTFPFAFSERELTFTFTICYRPFVCRLSPVTFVRPTQGVQIFRNISTALGTLAIHWHPLKISQRSSQGNPFAGGVKHNRGSKI